MRLISFNLFTFPSTTPLFCGSVSPAVTAALSRFTPEIKPCNSRILLAFTRQSQSLSCSPVRVREPGEQTAGPTHTLDRLQDAETEAERASLVLQLRVLQADEGKGTSPVVQGQESVD